MARPRFVATDEQRKMVRSMAAFGTRQEDIACCLGLRSTKTLRRHFREELDRGSTEANAQVAQSLYRQAIAGNTLATMFWLKVRAGWKEGATNAPRPVEVPPFVVMREKEVV